MLKLLISLFASCAMAGAFGQEKFNRNDIYFEAGGNGLFGSLNYERQFTAKPGLGARIGLGFYSEKAFYLTIPVGINYLFQLKNTQSYIDAGVGVTWARVDWNRFGDGTKTQSGHFFNFVPSIGYRKHTQKDLMWRVSLTPVANSNGFIPWLGASVGKRF